MKRSVTSTTEYYQQAIDILQGLDGDTQGKADMLIEIAKRSPKTLVDMHKAINIVPEEQRIYNEINDMFDGNNKIMCIKRYRELTGAGLKDAKDWVEANFF